MKDKVRTLSGKQKSVKTLLPTNFAILVFKGNFSMKKNIIFVILLFMTFSIITISCSSMKYTSYAIYRELWGKETWLYTGVYKAYYSTDKYKWYKIFDRYNDKGEPFAITSHLKEGVYYLRFEYLLENNNICKISKYKVRFQRGKTYVFEIDANGHVNDDLNLSGMEWEECKVFE